jgi:hypothetical protein
MNKVTVMSVTKCPFLAALPCSTPVYSVRFKYRPTCVPLGRPRQDSIDLLLWPWQNSPAAVCLQIFTQRKNPEAEKLDGEG